MKQRKRRKTLKDSVIYCGKQIWIQKLQESKNDSNICIVISNGYTTKCVPVTGGYKVEKRDEPDISMFNKDIEILVCYYQHTCDGLTEATDELKDFLEYFASGKELWLIGHSKSAQSQLDIKFKMLPVYENINVITVSSTFGGTNLANEKLFKHMPKHFPHLMNFFFGLAFKNTIVETDVASDSEYIMNHYKSNRLVTLNYVTKITDLRNVQSVEGMFNAFLNWALMYDMRCGGDGIVDVKSQTLGVDSSKNKFLNCPHCHGLADACCDLVIEFSHLGRKIKRS